MEHRNPIYIHSGEKLIISETDRCVRFGEWKKQILIRDSYYLMELPRAESGFTLFPKNLSDIVHTKIMYVDNKTNLFFNYRILN